MAIENDAGVGIWEVQTGRLITRFDTGSGRITSLALRGGRLAFVSADGTARLFDVRSKRQLFAVSDDKPVRAYLTPTSFHVLLTQPGNGSRTSTVSEIFAFGSTRFLNLSKALSQWVQLEKQACAMIGADQQLFSDREIESDLILSSNWRIDRNVCSE